METNIILAGVGGQGILSISYVIDMASLKQGLHFKQSEVHGMSQRGGAVQSHLRVADRTIYSDLVPRGRGSLILGVEPLESLRYIDYLGPAGHLVSSVDPFVNIDNYPPLESLLDALSQVPNHILVFAERLAREAGSARAQNMVLLGAASPYLGIKESLLQEGIMEAFARKGERVQSINLEAFQAGKAAGASYLRCREAQFTLRQIRALMSRLRGGVLEEEAVPLWQELMSGSLADALLDALCGDSGGKLPGTAAIPQAILAQGPAAQGQLTALLYPG